MTGMVGLVCQDNSRYSMFWLCKDKLVKPEGTINYPVLTTDRVLGRNICVRGALDSGADWLLMLDDDHAFGGDLLLRLLSHNVPVVGALYLQRQPPFKPIAYTHRDENDVYHNLNLHNHGDDDLVEVQAVGTGGILIRTDVLRQMDDPWFEHGRASEDLIFCDKVNAYGLGPVYVDLGARMGHIQPAALWPSHDGVDWQIGFAMADGFRVTLPAVEAETTA